MAGELRVAINEGINRALVALVVAEAQKDFEECMKQTYAAVSEAEKPTWAAYLKKLLRDQARADLAGPGISR